MEDAKSNNKTSKSPDECWDLWRQMGTYLLVDSKSNIHIVLVRCTMYYIFRWHKTSLDVLVTHHNGTWKPYNMLIAMIGDWSFDSKALSTAYLP